MRKTRSKSLSSTAKKRNSRIVKQFGALARVSSREQEREGWSLDVQVDDLHKEATRRQGKIVKLFKIAETASKSEERKTFKELINWAIKNKADIDGLLLTRHCSPRCAPSRRRSPSRSSSSSAR